MATRKILFRGQTRHKGEKTSISGKPLPGIWVTGGIFPQNKGYERAIIYTQDPKVEKHVVYAETVGQYTGVDDVLETPVFEDDITTPTLAEDRHETHAALQGYCEVRRGADKLYGCFL